jgi:hypothetical protein
MTASYCSNHSTFPVLDSLLDLGTPELARGVSRLFKQLKHAIESSGIKNLEKWRRPDKKPLLARRAGREII